MPTPKRKEDLPDIQCLTDGFPRMGINKVGIRNVKIPIKVMRRDKSFNEVAADCSIYTNLTEECKGANMSRYRILIEENLIDKNVELASIIKGILQQTKTKLGSGNSYLKIRFPYFITQKAPVSKIVSYIEIMVTFEGRLEIVDGKEVVEIYLTAKVPYTSLCPCSKQISDYGAHNQRSFADVSVKLQEGGDIIWIEELYDFVTKHASSPIINTLKREDEAYQTELMYENPVFVEDMVRLLAVTLNNELDKRIADYAVVVTHEESIHTHDAIAIITAGREMQ